MDKITVKDLDLYYGDFKALKTVNMNIAPHEVTAFIGPSGCGKSTLLKSLNRMNDLVAVSYTHLQTAQLHKKHFLSRGKRPGLPC